MFLFIFPSISNRTFQNRWEKNEEKKFPELFEFNRNPAPSFRLSLTSALGGPAGIFFLGLLMSALAFDTDWPIHAGHCVSGIACSGMLHYAYDTHVWMKFTTYVCMYA